MIREYVAEDLEIPNADVDENGTSVSQSLGANLHAE